MPGAGLLIFRPDGLAFLVKRSGWVKDAGSWDVPGGGVEPGETAIQTALREAREEAGSLPPVNIFASHDAPGYITFFASISEEEARSWRPPLSLETDGWGWFDPLYPPSPLRGNVREVFSHL